MAPNPVVIINGKPESIDPSMLAGGYGGPTLSPALSLQDLASDTSDLGERGGEVEERSEARSEAMRLKSNSVRILTDVLDSPSSPLQARLPRSDRPGLRSSRVGD